MLISLFFYASFIIFKIPYFIYSKKINIRKGRDNKRMIGYPLGKIEKVIKNPKNKTFGIATHSNPDSDAIGSAVALHRGLTKLGKKVDILMPDKGLEKYNRIIEKGMINKMKGNKYTKYDVIFLLDCSSIDRTPVDIERLSNFIITIDHHYNAEPFGNIYVNENVASTGIIIYYILKKITSIDSDIATCLYLTIKGDTSSFRNVNTDSLCHKASGELISCGANTMLVNDICDQVSLETLKLMGNTFSNLRYDKDYKILHLLLRREDVLKVADYEQAATLIDYMKNVKDVNISYIFLEGKNGLRIKARSKTENVADILENFNGGGHPNAAGGIIYGENIYNMVESVLKYTRNYIDNKTKNNK